MYLKSFYDFERDFTEPRRLEGEKIVKGMRVVLPAHSYTRANRERGKRNTVQIDEKQLAFLQTSKIFRYLLAKGENGGYVLLHDLPDASKTVAERLADERAKNERLQAELSALKGESKAPKTYTRAQLEKMQFIELHGIAAEREIAVKSSPTLSDLVDAILDAQTPKTSDREKALRRLSNKELRELAEKAGPVADGVKRDTLIAMILRAEG